MSPKISHYHIYVFIGLSQSVLPLEFREVENIKIKNDNINKINISISSTQNLIKS